MSSINERESHILQSVLTMAQTLLDEQGEFLPFGCAMNFNDEISYIHAQNEEEHPSSHDIISILDESFLKSIQSGDYFLCAICCNIYIKMIQDGIESKQNAVQIRFIGKKHSNQVTISYEIDENLGARFQ